MQLFAHPVLPAILITTLLDYTYTIYTKTMLYYTPYITILLIILYNMIYYIVLYYPVRTLHPHLRRLLALALFEAWSPSEACGPQGLPGACRLGFRGFRV